MLVYNFGRVFKARGIDKPYSFLLKNGFTSNLANRIGASNVDKISLSSMSKLCVLLNCVPSDFYEYVPGTENLNADHVMHSLKREKDEVNLAELTRGLPMGKIAEVVKLLKGDK